MAHVLIGWEFGGNRGHASKAAALARALRAAGHEVTLALQQVDSVAADAVDGCSLWQAPLSPRLLLNSARSDGRPPATLGDILARLGMDSPQLIERLIGAWRRLFSVIRPDVVCGDYAPFLLLAARDLFPTIATGTGFDLPPASLSCFPSLTAGPPATNEASILAGANAALSGLGMKPLDALPQIFAADETIVGTFRELDPYRVVRAGPLTAPADLPSMAEVHDGRGEEVFVYGSVQIAEHSPLWEGLSQSKLPIRVFVPNVGEAYLRRLQGRGFLVEDSPVPFATIAARSRMLVSHGGHGFVCSGLFAGIPQVICPTDLEKALIGAAIARMGVGGVSALGTLRPEAFGVSLRQLYEQGELAERARAMGEDLQSRKDEPQHEAIVQAVARLA